MPAWANAPRILYVPGNHEYYGTDIDGARKKLAEECATHGITLLDSDAIVIDDVHFIGATLWTDFLLDCIASEPGAHRAGLGISDFDGWIQHERGTGRFTTYESVRRHKEERAFIEAELADAERDGTTTVVITHHAPTPRSIAPRYHGSRLNPAFASNLESFIGRFQPTLWIHGHVHSSVDVVLGETRVLANPGGVELRREPGLRPHPVCRALNVNRHDMRWGLDSEQKGASTVQRNAWGPRREPPPRGNRAEKGREKRLSPNGPIGQTEAGTRAEASAHGPRAPKVCVNPRHCDNQSAEQSTGRANALQGEPGHGIRRG